MNLTLTVGPVKEPVTIDELRDHLRIDDEVDDAVLVALNNACRTQCEELLGRALITQTWAYKLDTLPPVIRLPRPPLQSISTIVYTDDAGDPQTLAASLYRVDTSEPGRITPAYGESWPTVLPVTSAITVTFVAGYGDDPADVPESIRAWIKLYVAHLFENREPAVVGTVAAKVPDTLDALMAPHRFRWHP
jgi:uncharacterized phiE125 gp8 family phage protein